MDRHPKLRKALGVEAEVCSCLNVHENLVSKARAHMIDDRSIQDLSGCFKVFGDATRLRILLALQETELCVCDIAQLLDMSQSAISHQLRVLKQARLVKNRREGKEVYYSLDDDHVYHIIHQGLNHVREIK